MQTDWVKTALRVPRDLHAIVHQQADGSDRSFNAEVIHQLRTAYSKHQQQEKPGNEQNTKHS